MKNLLGTIGMCFTIISMYLETIPTWLGVVVGSISTCFLLSIDIDVSWMKRDINTIVNFLKGGRNG